MASEIGDEKEQREKTEGGTKVARRAGRKETRIAREWRVRMKEESGSTRQGQRSNRNEDKETERKREGREEGEK